jgi:L-aspartate oxidase
MENTIINTDFAVIGSGIAGLITALQLSGHGQVCLITKGSLKDSATELAQGGIAAVIEKDDSTANHYKDTLKAGAGLCNKKAVKVLVEDGQKLIKELIKAGISFDKTKEGVHSFRRILHAGDATGHEIEMTLIKNVLKEKNIKVYENTTALELITHEKKCFGVFAKNNKDNKTLAIQSKAAFLATGGIANIYSQSTHPLTCLGDGIALAYRAGAALENLEFIQFHPTTLHSKKIKKGPLFLISEAVRGEGAVLRNTLGERFMLKYHPLGDLAPRDVVSRAILKEMRKTLSDHVYLDLAGIQADLKTRFPTIYEHCLKENYKIDHDMIPVAPAAHYLMGGIKINTNGQTSLKALYAVGEVSCSGAHGANRLASNSLLDGLVFGFRAAQNAAASLKNTTFKRPGEKIKQQLKLFNKTYAENKKIDWTVREKIQQLMWYKVGIIRRGDMLKEVITELERFEKKVLDHETKNLILVAKLVAATALKRKESRGAHFRLDYPKTSFFWKRPLKI